MKTGRETGPGKEGAGLARRKVTAKDLEAMGYRGFERAADGTVQEGIWVLDYIALAANHFPERLRFGNDMTQGIRTVTYSEALADGRTLFAARKLRQEEAGQPLSQPVADSSPCTGEPLEAGTGAV